MPKYLYVSTIMKKIVLFSMFGVKLYSTSILTSFHETLLFDRFLIMYDLSVFTCIIYLHFCISLCECHMY